MSDFKIFDVLEKYVLNPDSLSTITVLVVSCVALFRSFKSFFPHIFSTFNSATQTEISLKSNDVFCQKCKRCEYCASIAKPIKPLALENRDDCYSMTAKPRGFCVIINNINFKKKHENRHGSQVDEKNLRDIFEYLGFDVKVNRDVNNEKMNKILEIHSTSRHLRKHDAFVLIVMSRGDEYGIVLADSSYITIDALITPFNNAKCPALIGKPKLFFIQACSGSFNGYSNPEETFVDGFGRRSKIKNTVPHFTDMFLSFSIIQEFVSRRHTAPGSWYYRALFQALKENASTKDFISILNEVNCLLINEKTGDGEKQLTSLQLLGVTKKLYFNPLVAT